VLVLPDDAGAGAAAQRDDVDVGHGQTEPVRNAMLRLTQPFNVGRQPALTIPCGRTRTSGLPVGLQLAGASGHTSGLLEVGLSVERALARR
jgi:aspartyl-tRNA(Asn)/glutamyl-tRNA(Gln) amidotransferase subunit A